MSVPDVLLGAPALSDATAELRLEAKAMGKQRPTEAAPA
jgi:hypothetical protein